MRLPASGKRPSGWSAKGGQPSRPAISRGAAQLLVALVGADLGRLDTELAKVLDFAGDGAVVDEDHVRAVASAVPTARIFDLLDAVAERRVADAARQLSLLLENGEPPLRALAALTRQMRTLLQVRLLAERRAGAPSSCRSACGCIPMWSRSRSGRPGAGTPGNLPRGSWPAWKPKPTSKPAG